MLKETLQYMIDEAKRKEKFIARRSLHGGLHLALTISDSAVHLALARKGTYPSEREWRTVLNNFPYKVEFVTPTQFIDRQNRFALRGMLPIENTQKTEK